MFVEESIEKCYRNTTSTGFLYEIGKDFPAFRGHFEGHPLLPAVCQISFCVHAASCLLSRKVELKAIKKSKFLSPILPGMMIEVTLSKRADDWYFAEITSVKEQKKISQIILQFN